MSCVRIGSWRILCSVSANFERSGEVARHSGRRVSIAIVCAILVCFRSFIEVSSARCTVPKSTRGMAEEHGWLITICTEMPWKSFVLNNSLSRGKIQFRPSGGNTEKRISTSLSKWAMQHTSELIQMSILASAEAEFFPSTTVFLDHVRSLEHTRRVDLVVYGLTVVGVALLIGELCAKPIIGFILQPSIIPSKDKTWTAVQAIQTHNLANWFDRVEDSLGRDSSLHMRSSFRHSFQAQMG